VWFLALNSITIVINTTWQIVPFYLQNNKKRKAYQAK
jgi:hypothetical protein